MGKSLGSRGTNLGSREQRENFREQGAKENKKGATQNYLGSREIAKIIQGALKTVFGQHQENNSGSR